MKDGSTGKAILALEDGTVFEGTGFGARAEAAGEVVFQTSPTGYQEILTDPGSAGQLVVFAYPELGNVGVTDVAFESATVHAAGVVARHVALAPSSHLAKEALQPWLASHGTPGIEGIDTRMLIRHIRDGGPKRGVLSTLDGADAKTLVEKARALPPATGLVARVSTKVRYELPAEGASRFHVVVYDLGVKRSLLRRLAEQGCRLTVVPFTTTAADVLALQPDGIVLSGGPGDPSDLSEAEAAVRALLGKTPILGVNLGHQLLAKAAGARMQRLVHPHHGANYPVKELSTGKVAITGQSHSFAVDAESLGAIGAAVTHSSVHDGSVEGIELPAFRAIGVQFHPESAPGPLDSLALFGRFTAMMEGAPVPDRSQA
ncbi:glutamine-hydrolyzing carbamoyl-phosphate synthase small subunit [Vulgatibacter incomptus]|uniref:Carbamoyl phosphate synthase small chain n=1 Tax=Vulgatibacter incomptus TaxID=1391653 RepID=A0A0K1PBZ5_9BACT|nr:glutamine-hydrolyzing carbamoyl-phosphate synthase small subunit [Vulgatibacter incomptus]AKU91022.1 Carbamoyl-phosphate synthase small chain [Vulgatibacter incomptus]